MTDERDDRKPASEPGAPADDGKVFEVSSILSRTDHQGKVNVSFGGKPLLQVDVAQAREIASFFLQAAEAAETDTAVWAWLRTEVGIGEAEAAAMIGALRKHRQGAVS